MTGEDWVRLREQNNRLRQYIMQQARRHAWSTEDAEDYVQEAWLRLLQQPAEQSDDYYRRQAYNAIHAAYERDRSRRKTEKKAQVSYRIRVKRR